VSHAQVSTSNKDEIIHDKIAIDLMRRHPSFTRAGMAMVAGAADNILKPIKSVLVLAVVVFVLTPGVHVTAQSGAQTPPRPELNDASGLKAFMDGVMEKQMAENYVPAPSRPTSRTGRRTTSRPATSCPGS
jgi:hypothetical protein